MLMATLHSPHCCSFLLRLYLGCLIYMHHSTGHTIGNILVEAEAACFRKPSDGNRTHESARHIMMRLAFTFQTRLQDYSVRIPKCAICTFSETRIGLISAHNKMCRCAAIYQASQYPHGPHCTFAYQHLLSKTCNLR